MPTVRNRRQNVQSPRKPSETVNLSYDHQNESEKMSEYEVSREKRIRENLERMGKLGILDLSLKLKSSMVQRHTSRNRSDRRTPQHPSPIPVRSGSVRRSSRLQNVTPVSYAEIKEPSRGKEDVGLEAGSKPEVYTEEHEKLLGHTERSWTLSVDGYGEDGKRIYDSFKGKTCHQCRQKTLGYRTQCSDCDLVQGQFCGDCLYMRYGEHVLEALQNPNWTCPVCRGICNCSLCRQAKGWAPTGAIYRKISKLGYKSVAHYLIQTKRSDMLAAKPVHSSEQVSAKRSLPFLDENATPDGSLLVNESCLTPEDVGDRGEMCFSHNQGSASQVSVRRSLPFCDIKALSEKKELADVSNKPNDKIDGECDGDMEARSGSDLIPKTGSVNDDSHTGTGEKLSQTHNMDMRSENALLGENERKTETHDEKEERNTESKYGNDDFALKTNSKSKDSAHSLERSPNSVAGRLKQRRKLERDGNHVPSFDSKTSVNDCRNDNNDVPEMEAKETKVTSRSYGYGENDNGCVSHKTQASLSDEATGSSKRNAGGIAGRLRPRCSRT